MTLYYNTIRRACWFGDHALSNLSLDRRTFGSQHTRRTYSTNMFGQHVRPTFSNNMFDQHIRRCVGVLNRQLFALNEKVKRQVHRQNSVEMTVKNRRTYRGCTVTVRRSGDLRNQPVNVAVTVGLLCGPQRHRTQGIRREGCTTGPCASCGLQRDGRVSNPRVVGGVNPPVFHPPSTACANLSFSVGEAGHSS